VYLLTGLFGFKIFETYLQTALQFLIARFCGFMLWLIITIVYVKGLKIKNGICLHSKCFNRFENLCYIFLVRPHFLIRPQNKRVPQGNTVDFQCQVAGRPQPHIVWTVNGEFAFTTGRIFLHDCSFTGPDLLYGSFGNSMGLGEDF